MRWLTLASSNPMGQQNYEQAIMQALLDLVPDGLSFEHDAVSSLRGSGTLRFPARSIGRSRWIDRIVGRRLKGRALLVHRFDLRIPPTGGREVVTVHDFPPARFADEGAMPAWVTQPLGATPVICPSEFAASEIRDLFGATDVTVIPYGVRPSFVSPDPVGEADLRQLGITGPFVLHAAGASQRKNLKALAYAWRTVAREFPDHQLMLCGPGHPVRTSLFAGLPRAVLAGPQPLDRVAQLMAAAEVVVVPSTYEGFGLPALEAMAVGTAALVARAGALTEVVADGAHLVEPSAGGLADGLAALLADRGLRARYAILGTARAKQFSWLAAAEAHAAVYRRIANGA